MSVYYELHWFDKKTQRIIGETKLPDFSKRDVVQLLGLPDDEDVSYGDFDLTDDMVNTLAEIYPFETSHECYDYQLSATDC